MAVNTPCIDYKKMEERNSWDMIETIDTGTKGMREVEEFLPKEEGETPTDYDRRRKRSFLYNGFSDTRDKCVARPFSRPMTWKNVPLELEKRCFADMDGDGQSIQALGMEAMEGLVKYGKVHLFEDFPGAPEDQKEGIVNKIKRKIGLKKELALDLKSTTRVINAPDVIGWKFKKEEGKPKLIEVRIKENVIEEGTDWEQEEVEQIRVVVPGHWYTYRKSNEDKEKWVQHKHGPMKNMSDEIPLVTIYANKKGYFIANAPLLELVWADLEHWQSLSDQKNILRVARFAILFASGFTEEDVKDNKIISPNKLFQTQNKDAKLGFIEHTGKAMESGFKDLERIEERKVALGSNPMIQRMGNVRVIGQAVNESKSRSLIEMWVEAMNLGLAELARLKGKWMKIATPDDMSFDIYSDFVFGTEAGKEITEIREARKNRDLSHETYLKELKRYAVISDDVDPAEEMRRIKAEPPKFEVDFFGTKSNPATSTKDDKPGKVDKAKTNKGDEGNIDKSLPPKSPNDTIQAGNI